MVTHNWKQLDDIYTKGDTFHNTEIDAHNEALDVHHKLCLADFQTVFFLFVFPDDLNSFCFLTSNGRQVNQKGKPPCHPGTLICHSLANSSPTQMKNALKAIINVHHSFAVWCKILLLSTEKKSTLVWTYKWEKWGKSWYKPSCSWCSVILFHIVCQWKSTAANVVYISQPV